MKLEAKQRLMSMQAISLKEWQAECKKVYPKARFIQEAKGDWSAVLSSNADVVGVYSQTSHVCWVMREPGEFDEYDVHASTTNPISDGTAFETLVDGAPPHSDKPIVQKLTNDDGSVELPDEQPLLIDDLPYNRQMPDLK